MESLPSYCLHKIFMTYENTFLRRLGNLSVFKKGERRAPHKPLLLLVAISRLQRGQKEISFSEVKQVLEPLLYAYAPPVKSRHQPELPYWHLQTDALWEIPESKNFERQKGGFPKMGDLRRSSGHLVKEFADALEASPNLLERSVKLLLDSYFPESLHEDIAAAIGLNLPGKYLLADSQDRDSRRHRDPRFREKVLTAYEHRCAVTGFRAALSGSYFGCEAAHVRWHSYDGPDTVDNGIALEPTMHKLFDVGAWSLTDNLTIIVSQEFTGTDTAVKRLRRVHGQPLKKPLPGEPTISIDFVRWHREPEEGGVFRHPPLRL